MGVGGPERIARDRGAGQLLQHPGGEVGKEWGEKHSDQAAALQNGVKVGSNRLFLVGLFHALKRCALFHR
jgi:hypothetical protein